MPYVLRSWVTNKQGYSDEIMARRHRKRDVITGKVRDILLLNSSMPSLGFT